MKMVHRLIVLFVLFFAVTHHVTMAENNDRVSIDNMFKEAGCPLSRDQFDAFHNIKLDQHMRYIVIALDTLFTDTQIKVLRNKLGSIPESQKAEWDKLGIQNLLPVYVLERKNMSVTELQLSNMPQMTGGGTEQASLLERYFTPEQANVLRYYMDGRQR